MSTVKYKCDTCKRSIEVLENREGLNNYSKCIITKGCRGKLYITQRNPYNIRENFPQPENLDLQNYSPRRAFFEYKKTTPSEKWEITHNMGVYPSVTVYTSNSSGAPEILTRDQYQISAFDKNSIRLDFNNPISGIVHLVSRSSLDPEPETIDIVQNNIQVTYNNVMTLGFLSIITDVGTGQVNASPTPIYTSNTNMPIIIDVVIKEPNREEVFCEETFDSNSTMGSPWVDWNALLLRKRRNYNIRSKSLRDFAIIQDLYEDVDDIPDGTQFRITHIRYGKSGVRREIRSRNVLMLLAESPFSTNDKILTEIIDVGNINSSPNNNYVFLGGDLYAATSESLYPEIEKASVLVDPNL